MKFEKPQKELMELYRELVLEDDLESFYSFFKQNFNSKYTKTNEGFVFSQKKNLVHNIDNIEIETSGLVGVDLPSLFVNEGLSKGKTIMSLFQDPLRDRKDFSLDNKIIVGTPFALHSSLYRNKGMGLFYSGLTSGLLNKFDKVFYSDAVKVYFEKESNLIGRAAIKVCVNDILQREIDVIKPDVLLLCGGDAKKAISKIKIPEGTIVKSAPHPSARSSAWHKIGAEDYSYETRVKMIVDIANA